MDFFNQVYLGNTGLDWTLFIGIILISVLLKKVFSRIIAHIIYLIFKKSATAVGRDKFDEIVKKPLEFIIVLGGIFMAGFYIQPPEEWGLAPLGEFGVRTVIKDFMYILLVYGIIWLGMKLAEYLGLIFAHRATVTDSKLDDQLVPFLVDLLKVLVAVVGIFIILSDVFEVNIATLIAGLGVGGIALALASKDSIENLLGSFTIFFDQPFKVGDFVTFGGVTGTIEKVGFRSTRIRTTEKTYVTVPNRNIINTELDNFSERTHRRARFEIGLTYDTTAEQIKKISEDILEVLMTNELTTNDPIVRFTAFGDSSLNVLVQYLAFTKEYQAYLELNEKINFQIMEIVYKHGASFAFPSQSIYIEKNKN
jgi:MscS family membrane protein